jgi:NitT/TauT family transport system substrate-binding protein
VVRVHLLPLLALAIAASSCRRVDDDRPLRLGYFPNHTHGQALVGVDDGTFAAALGGRLEPRMFNAGPAAMEALLSGELDASYVGPGPAAIAYLRSRGEGLKVVAGAASGGAALVVRDARRPQDLAGKRVASPQLGNTQDVALRMWLRANGLGDKGGPAGVEVTPLANPDILALFARGDLAGAWVPEPWCARLVAEAKGRILVDERTLWPDGRFPTTILVVSRRALERRSRDVQALVRAHVALTRRWADDPRAFGRLVNEAYGRRTGKPLPDAILEDALSRVEPTSDPLAPQLHRMAQHAQALGFAPEGDVSGIVDANLLLETARRMSVDERFATAAPPEAAPW